MKYELSLIVALTLFFSACNHTSNKPDNSLISENHVNSAGETFSQICLINKEIDLNIQKLEWIDTGTLKEAMTIKVYNKIDTFFSQTLPCFTASFIKNDTIFITGHMNNYGWGFQLLIFRSGCLIRSFAASDGIMYKHNESDPDSLSFIMPTNIEEQLILSKAPLFEIGEVISGHVKLKSVPFYYTILKKYYRIDLSAFFKTAAIKQLNDTLLLYK